MARVPGRGDLGRADFLIASGFGIGCAPVAPGSFGSLAALPVAWLLQSAAGGGAVLAAACLCFAVGCWASARVVAQFGAEDPSYIVVDEIAAQLLVLAALPATVVAYAIGFLAFRLADIAKPFPAGWCDRNVHGGFGVMLDDAVAGFQAAAVAWTICQFLPS
jgi:phosphatidylglycerophosphatase A